MRIIKPSYEFITPINQDAVLERLEECGRVCYKSEGRIAPKSAKTFVLGLIMRGHESVLEHCTLSVRFTVDRGVSHELVRHRLAAYSQESTRYCNYDHDRFGSEITVIEPCFLLQGTDPYRIWKEACAEAEMAYFGLLGAGCSPQEARSVLPNSLKTEVVATMNIRQWRHVLRQRCGSAAHPQMREIMRPLLAELTRQMPVLFTDVMELVMEEEK